MNGYAIGMIVEAIIAAGLIVALIVLAVKKKKAPAENAAGEEMAAADGAAEPVAEPVEEAAAEPVAEPAPVTEPVAESVVEAPVAYIPVVAPIEAPAAEEEDALGNKIVFAASDRSFSEAYATLSEEQKRYFILIREYALHKPNATEKRGATSLVIRSNKKAILKLKIRRGITIAAFKLENDLLRNYRRNSESAKAFRLRETELYIEDENGLETARGMVDLMLEQYARERQEAIERRKAKRAARRRAALAAKRNSQAQEASEPSSPDGQE